jgi:phosphoheptose isomerase
MRPQPSLPSPASASVGNFLDDYCLTLAAALESIDRLQFRVAVETLSDAMDRDATIFVCGNGGSAAIANHMVCDHQKGVSTDTFRTPKIVSLSSNIELVTAIANDIGYEEVFSYALRLHARRGDVLVTISSSGNSENIVKALWEASTIGMHTIAMSGFDGGRSRAMADVSLHVAVDNYGVIEDSHQTCMHVLAQTLRARALCPRRSVILTSNPIDRCAATLATRDPRSSNAPYRQGEFLNG